MRPALCGQCPGAGEDFGLNPPRAGPSAASEFDGRREVSAGDHFSYCGVLETDNVADLLNQDEPDRSRIGWNRRRGGSRCRRVTLGIRVSQIALVTSQTHKYSLDLTH